MRKSVSLLWASTREMERSLGRTPHARKRGGRWGCASHARKRGGRWGCAPRARKRGGRWGCASYARKRDTCQVVTSICGAGDSLDDGIHSRKRGIHRVKLLPDRRRIWWTVSSVGPYSLVCERNLSPLARKTFCRALVWGIVVRVCIGPVI